MEGTAQQSTVLEVQRLLIERGYEPGPADGLMGRRTISAIKQFQTDIGISTTGVIDEETVTRLRSSVQSNQPEAVLENTSTSVLEQPDRTTEQLIAPSQLEVKQPAQSAPVVPLVEVPARPPVSGPTSVPARKESEDGGGWLSWIIAGLVGWWLIGRRKKSTKKSKPPQSRHPAPELAARWQIKVDSGRSINAPYDDGAADIAKMTWHPLGEKVVVAGRAIDGLVYTGKPKRYQDKHKFMINPSLRVGTAGHLNDRQAMPYWPDYADIDAQARSVYLNWLADGRRATDADVGYVFLFFYGLEYRFFRDNPDANERAIILQEVKDLLEVYGENHSVQRYLGNFVEFASLQVPGALKPEPVFDRHGWELPLMVRLALGTYADSGKSVPVNWMLSWIVTHPEHRLRTPAKRCFDEFKILFASELTRKYPDGYTLRKSKKKLNLVYQAASGSFHHQLSGKIADLPDISTLTKPLDEMAALAETVTERLEKYSRYLGRNPEGRGTLEAQALLPAELRAQFPSEELDALRFWVAGKIEGSGLVPAVDVIARLEGEKPTKITKSQLTSAADSLARLGFGLAPDPRFALRAPKTSEPVVLFDLGEPVEQLEDVSQAYRRGLIQLALGAFVAHADGDFAAKEKETLQAQAAQIGGLSDQERKRLRANIDWFSAVPPDIALLRRRLSAADDAESDSIRTAIVAIALSDGMIRPQEVTGIEKIYKALGLDPALVYSDLHSGDGPIRVKQAEPIVRGEAIPQEVVGGSIGLDMERIASIRSDTKRVSAVLGAVFMDIEDQAERTTIQSTSLLSGLNAKHTGMVIELIEQEHWTEEAFAQLAAKHGVLSSGALESINEWAFDTYDDPLLEAYDGFDVVPEVATNIRSVLEKEGNNVENQAT